MSIFVQPTNQPTMQKKNWLYVILATALLVTGLTVFTSSAPIEKQEIVTPIPTCCKEKMSECTPVKKKATNPSSEMIIDNLSRQFISIPVFSY